MNPGDKLPPFDHSSSASQSLRLISFKDLDLKMQTPQTQSTDQLNDQKRRRLDEISLNGIHSRSSMTVPLSHSTSWRGINYNHQQFPIRSRQFPPHLGFAFNDQNPSLIRNQKPLERDDDVYIDEDMTNRNICLGMIRTDIVTDKDLSLIKDELFESVRMSYQGKTEEKYTIVISSLGSERKFYGWVPFPDTGVLGPLIECRRIWCDAVIPRGKVKRSRVPLYIIIYCCPTDIEYISNQFQQQNRILRDPPFFDNRCRYKNPHKHLQQSRVSSFPIGRPGRQTHPNDRSVPNYQNNTEKQTRLDIAKLLQSIPNDVNIKKKKADEGLCAIEPIKLKNEDGNENENNQDQNQDDDDDDDEDSHVKGLNIVLLPHQVRGVAWMIDRENNERSQGGILADVSHMGLGKTIQTIALIASTMPSDRPEGFDKDRRVTLIITPLALIQQWATEIRTKTVPGKMKVMVHHGPNRTKDPMEFLNYDVVVTTYQVVASDIPSSEKKSRRRKSSLTMEDGAIQTPGSSTENSSPSLSSSLANSPLASSTPTPIVEGALRPGCGPLFQLKWHRVVLDEAQQIKNKSTRSALSCSELDADKRWCLTGTPIQNHVDEIYSLIRFLRIQPLSDHQTFKKTISIPILSGQGQIAFERLKAVLMAVMLRRTKEVLSTSMPLTTTNSSGTTSSTTLANNNNSLEGADKITNGSSKRALHLPLRDKQDIVLSFSPEERGLYELLTTKTRDTVQEILHSGKGDRNYLNMLCMLLRLRQACDHPQLVLKAIEPDGDESELEGVFSAVSNLSSSAPYSRDMRDHGDILKQIHQNRDRDQTGGLGWEKVGQSDFHPQSSSSSSPLSSVSSLTSLGVCGLCARQLSVEFDRPGSYCSNCKDQLEQRIRTASNDGGKNTYLTSTKIEKMIEILQTARRDHPTEKTIIFSQFTSMLNLIEEPLRQCGFKYCRYDGSMPSQLREKSLEALRTDPECVVMLISLKCGSLGLNLTAANRVILMDIWWNPSVEEQAIDRVHRIGQRLPVHVFRLIIDKTIEQKIMTLQDKKAQMVKGALGDGLIKSTKLTSKEIRSLFDL
ncbi:SNF2 family N-terminal domain-containing protein [Phycomyces nitens]|nr:SNF2 family N-terminal domain-containing protein [Phycomyces nitens]